MSVNSLRLLRRPLPATGIVIVLVVALIAIFAPIIAPQDPLKGSFGRKGTPGGVLAAPSWQHPLGTDHFGRDELSRIIYGARITLMVGITASVVAVAIGVPLGMLAGYLGGWVDNLLIMRMADTVMAFPTLLLLIALASAIGPSIMTTIFIIGISFFPAFARLTRGAVLSVRETEYVIAAKAIGAPELRIMGRHVLPNVLPSIIVLASLLVSTAILAEASLSYLGLGIEPPTPAWGSMLRNGYPHLENEPLLSVAPGVAIATTVIGFNLLGDALRDTLDPRLRRSS